MDSDDLEKILESSLEDENIIISDPSLFPCKLIWIVSNNSYITKHQIIAITTPIDTTTNTLTNGTKDTVHTEETPFGDKETPFGAIDAVGPSTVTGDTVMEKLERTIKSNKNGKLIKLVENLTLLNSETIIARIESFECDHDIIVHGLCTYCSEPIKRKLTSSLGFISNNSEVMIRDDLAYQMECNEILNYLNDKKLCLVLDLDNTLLHATSQPPPTDIIIPIINYNLSNYISNTQANNQSNNVSENISKNVTNNQGNNISNGKYIQYGIDEKSIELQLELENSVIKTIVYNESETMFTNTYFKLRPGIFNFFHQIRDKFTLFLFTTGTKQHAESALQIIDPQLIYFSNRIFSRSHSNILNGVNTVTVSGPTNITVVPGTTKVPTNTTNSTTNTMNMAKGINLGTMSNNMNMGMNTSHRNFKKIDIKYYMKSLDKIFPNYKNLVIILDDTEHVWKDNLGLIKIHPYYFFPDLTYLNHFDLNNLTKSSASLQSICNYSNFIWYKLLYTSIHNTSIHSNNYSNSNNNNNSIGKNVNEMDEEGFMIPNSIPIMNNEFRYNGYLICNQRPTNIFINNNTTDKGTTTNNNTSTIGTRGTIIDNRKMKIIDNDKQLDKIIKLLNNIHETFFQHYYSILHSVNNSTNGIRDTTSDTNDGEVTKGTVGPSTVTDTVMGEKLKYMLDNELIPSASKILQEIHGKILKNVVLYSNTYEFINLNGLDVNFLSCSDFGKWALKFGATISNTINTNTVTGTCTTNGSSQCTDSTEDTATDTVKNINEVTHVIVNNKSNIKLIDSIKKVHIKWLEAVLYCHEYINEDKFNPDHWQIPYRSFWDILNS
ncbi:ctd-like phosphatase, putative [Theileria annulata]|uniref:protein-serine/threonine phosphatase n=1 Tax=Theileria annulata TaxID=5874 RepID=Q4UAX5_THEAN|nr:ctd-like phosphatase, putative [Theileria annulata]CAI76026.1 ctd-like phosphatase, putative [Theileria annulata]|eukprot:XP_955502.1 ctd-like phosphatase, putative [Theileria annulata]